MAGTVLWHDSSNPLAALQAFQYKHQAEMVEHEVSLWRFFCRIHKGGTLDLLKRRGSSAPARSKLCFGNPVMDCLTGAYEDVDETLAVIKKYVLQTLGMRLAVVWGDQQSYSRMVHLAIAGEAEYAWMIPAPGEFHFTVHALMAIHKKESGWWSALIEWVCLPYDEEAKPPQLGGGSAVTPLRRNGTRWRSTISTARSMRDSSVLCWSMSKKWSLHGSYMCLPCL